MRSCKCLNRAMCDEHDCAEVPPAVVTSCRVSFSDLPEGRRLSMNVLKSCVPRRWLAASCMALTSSCRSLGCWGLPRERSHHLSYTHQTCWACTQFNSDSRDEEPSSQGCHETGAKYRANTACVPEQARTTQQAHDSCDMSAGLMQHCAGKHAISMVCVLAGVHDVRRGFQQAVSARTWYLHGLGHTTVELVAVLLAY